MRESYPPPTLPPLPSPQLSDVALFQKPWKRNQQQKMPKHTLKPPWGSKNKQKNSNYPLPLFPSHPETTIPLNGVSVIFLYRNQCFFTDGYTQWPLMTKQLKVAIPLYSPPPLQWFWHLNYKIEDCYVIHNNACNFFLFYCFALSMWKFWFWKQSVYLCLSVFLIFGGVSFLNLARKWNIYYTAVNLQCVCRQVLQLYSLLVKRGGGY